jgi:hypothetical protein
MQREYLGPKSTSPYFLAAGQKSQEKCKGSDWLGNVGIGTHLVIYKAQRQAVQKVGSSAKMSLVSFRPFEPHILARAPRLAVLAVGSALRIRSGPT